jgi:hypothetical protein
MNDRRNKRKRESKRKSNTMDGRKERETKNRNNKQEKEERRENKEKPASHRKEYYIRSYLLNDENFPFKVFI